MSLRVIDPVCGHSVSLDRSWPARWDGMRWEFCSEQCRRFFVKHATTVRSWAAGTLFPENKEIGQ